MITDQTMLGEVLSVDRINLNLAGHTRDEVLMEFADMFEKAGALSDKQQFIQDAYAREAEGPTGIGDAIAIPHSKSSGVKRTMMAVGRTREPVEWPSLDDKPCRAFVMFAVRKDDQTQLVSLLAKTAVALCHKEVTEVLLHSEDAQKIMEALCGKEEI